MYNVDKEMIICVCARVSDNDIRKLCPAEPEEIMLKTNCAMNCGICFEPMLQIIQEFRQPAIESYLPFDFSR